MLRYEHAGKIYKGIVRRTTALTDFSLHVRAGEIVGLIGANGAGKTTAIMMALGYLTPTSGRISVLDAPPGAVATRTRMGWVPDEPIYPAEATAAGLLDHWLAGQGFARAERRRRTQEWLERFGLDRATGRRITTFSLGMQQKIALAMALSHDAQLLILDEPFSALDHRAVLRLCSFLKQFRERGGAVLVSSHHLAELELVCDRAVFLARGKIEREERTDGDRGQTSIHVALEDADAARTLLNAECPVFLSEWAIEHGVLQGTVTSADAVPDLVEFLTARRVRIRSVSDRRAHFEEIFLEMESGRN